MSYCERRNKNMHFQSWKFGILNGKKNLNTTDYGVFILAMGMEIPTKEIIFHLLTTIDLTDWIASQCLNHNFPRSILKRIKMQLERTVMAPRFQVDTSKHVDNFQDLFHIRRRKEKKTSRNEGLDGKIGKKIFCVCGFVLQ